MSEILSIGELLDLGGSASTAGLIPYSALEYSAQVITGISGTAIGGQGGTDSATVSAIASAYAESAASGKLDNSASGLWYPLEGNPSGFLTNVDLSPYAYASSVSSKVDQSAFDECCSSMSSVVSSLETSVTSMSSVVSGLTGDYLEKSASSMFQPSGSYQTAGDYAYNSSVSSKLDASASSQFAPSGDYADKSALSSYVPVSASGQFAPSGDYAFNSALSSKLDASASSQFQPSGNYQTAGDYQTAGNYMSASESSSFYPMTGNPSGFLVEHQSLTAYQDRSSISSWTGDMSSISGKLDQSAFTSYSSTVNNNITSIENNITAISSVVSGKADASAVHTYTGVSPVVVDNVNDQISLSATAVHLDSSMTAYTSGGSGFIGVNADFGAFVHTADMSGYIPTGESSKFQLTANMSGYIPTSESSKYYSTGNPSSFATTAQLDSGLSGKLDSSSQVVTSTAGSNNYVDKINGSYISAMTACFAGRAQSAYVKGSSIPISSMYYDIVDLQSAKLDTTAQTVTSLGMKSSYVSGINGSSLYAQSAYQSNKSEYASYADSAWISDHEQVPMSAFAYASAVSSKLDASAFSSKLDASASSDFYSTSNPSGFVTSSYNPSFGYNADDEISSIDGSAVAGGCKYTSPSGTVAIDNANGTLEIWNSAIAVTEHVTAGQTSYLGSSDSIWTNIYQSGEGKPAIPSGTNILYMVQLLQPLYNPDSAYSLEIKFTGDGAQTSVRSATDVHFPSAGGYTGSAMFSSDMNISALSFYINASETWYSTASASVSASSIVYPQTAYETSVQELALASQVPSMSAWQSLTAWATAQGWTP